MKKALLFIVASSLGLSAMAQAPFFENTTYRGAFAPAPVARWTDNWCNFDPQNATYPATTVTVSGNITTNTTWSSSNVYLLDDALIYVKPGATLTIQAGTVIRGTGKGTLIIERGAKIIAQGTEASPIVFTSNAPAGSRDYGDWGGVVLCGAARHNLAAGPDAIVEGGIGDVPSQTGVHGGTNDDDSTGVLSFVRIEFCGISLTPAANSEINGLSMYSIGRKTKIDHIQVSFSGDDSFEWFGGAVDCKYLVAFRGWDDDFDTDNGFRGRIQFAAAVRDPQVADQSGSNGFESDNDANGSLRQPKTRPVFSNVTVVGPLNVLNTPGTINANYKRALHIRRNSGTSVLNSIFMGYPDAGFLLDARVTAANYCNDTLNFEANIIAGCINDFKISNADTLCITNAAAFVTSGAANNDTMITSEEVLLTSPYTITNPDLRPTAVSPAVTGADFTNSVLGTIIYVGLNDAENTAAQMSVFPNPSSNNVTLHVQAPKTSDAMIFLTDMTGKTVMMIPASQILEGSNTISFSVAGLGSGIYILNISTPAAHYTQKLVVQ